MSSVFLQLSHSKSHILLNQNIIVSQYLETGFIPCYTMKIRLKRWGVVLAGDKITIYDIAKEAGVSAATVSRVLSGYQNVSPPTRERVTAIIDKYQFRPSSFARGMFQQAFRMLGFILPSIENPYYAALFTAAHEEARKANYSVLVYRTSTTESIDEATVGQLIAQRLDGVLLLGGIVESHQPHGDLLVSLTLLQRHIPLVTICPPIAGLDCINFHSDLSSSVRQSVRHLHALGHHRIAFLGGSYQSRSASERELGFLDEMRKMDLSTAYYQEAGHTPEAGELGVARLLAPISKEDQPTAIIAINDLVALGAMRQLKRMGLSIPQDMAIIGCDNQFFCPYTDPPLTTVDLRPAELGRVAVHQLLSEVEKRVEDLAFTQVKESTLIIRESCGAKLGRREIQ